MIYFLSGLLRLRLAKTESVDIMHKTISVIASCYSKAIQPFLSIKLKKLVLPLAISLIIPVQSFASCAALQGKQLSDIPAIECPGFDGTAAHACKLGALPAQNGVINCILNGEEPPVVIRPNYGLGTPQINQVTNSGKCPPPLQVAATANAATLDSLGKKITGLFAPAPPAQQGGGCQISNVSDSSNFLNTNITNGLGQFAQDVTGNFVTNPANLNLPSNVSSGNVTDAMGNQINPLPANLVPALNPNVDVPLTPAYCLTPTTATVPPINCGGAIPTLRKFDPINVSSCNIGINLATCNNGTNVNACGCLVVGNVMQLPNTNSPNVDIGNFLYDSYAQDLSQTTRIINNTLVSNLTPNCSSNVSPYSTNNRTIFQIAGDRTSLVVPPSTTQLPIVSSSYSYVPVGGNIHLPYGDAASLFTNGRSIIRIPEGGTIVGPDGHEVTIPSSVEGTIPTLVSYGNGTVIIPLGGTVSIGNITTATNAYNSSSSAGNHNANGQSYTIKSVSSASNVSEYVQQTNLVPGGGYPNNPLADWVMGESAWTVDGNNCPISSGALDLITHNSVSFNLTYQSCHCDFWGSCKTCCVINGVNITGQYLSYSTPTATIYATSITSNSNALIPTRNISAPANSFLSLPSGTPADFSISQKGSISLPAGGSFLVPGSATNGGATITTPNGTVYTLNCPACSTISINVVQSSQLVSNGGGTVVLPNNTTYSMPSMLNSTINSSTYNLDLSGASNTSSSPINNSTNTLPVGTNIALPTGTHLPLGTNGVPVAITTIGNASATTPTTQTGSTTNPANNPNILTATGGNFVLPTGTVITNIDGTTNTLDVPEYTNIPAGALISLSPQNPYSFTLQTSITYSLVKPSYSDTAVPKSYAVPLPAGAVLPSGTIITFPTGTNYINIITNQIGVPAGTSIAVETDVTNNNSLVLPPQSPASNPPSPNPSCSR